MCRFFPYIFLRGNLSGERENRHFQFTLFVKEENRVTSRPDCDKLRMKQTCQDVHRDNVFQSFEIKFLLNRCFMNIKSCFSFFTHIVEDEMESRTILQHNIHIRQFCDEIHIRRICSLIVCKY